MKRWVISIPTYDLSHSFPFPFPYPSLIPISMVISTSNSSVTDRFLDFVYVPKGSGYLTNCSREFNQIYNFGTVCDNKKPIKFWGEQVKGQGHDEIKYGQKDTLGILKVMHSNITVTNNLSGKGISVEDLNVRVKKWSISDNFRISISGSCIVWDHCWQYPDKHKCWILQRYTGWNSRYSDNKMLSYRRETALQGAL